MGNAIIKYCEIFCWSKRHIHLHRLAITFPMNACTNFKIENSDAEAISLWGIFYLFTWACLSQCSQFILLWKWFMLFCMMVFSNRTILLFACCVHMSLCCHCAVLILADNLGTGTDYDCWEWKRRVREAREWLAEQRVISIWDSESDQQFKFEGKTVVRKRKQERGFVCTVMS